eukprot:TRINITY_DN11147_c0_g1_i1.p1 TRINITY_DN11147_c0_g1~~TRINITY_DN11147_c0_g1_i1.p1  ORF type:complete len:230 (+),score=42.04 TRINITY_DN11147_c0_g1_i1:109-798(+)
MEQEKDLSVLFEKIKAIQQINSEIITEIKGTNFIKKVELKNDTIKIRHKNKSSWLNTTIQMKDVPDIFNRKYNWTCRRYNDLIRINKTIVPFTELYLQLKSEISVPMLRIIFENVEHLHVLLGKIHLRILEDREKVGQLRERQRRSEEEMKRFERGLKDLNIRLLIEENPDSRFDFTYYKRRGIFVRRTYLLPVGWSDDGESVFMESTDGISKRFIISKIVSILPSLLY